MSTLCDHHKPKAGVEGKCSVPMWMGGCPSGFCDEPAYGEQYDEDGAHAQPHWPRRNRYGFYPEGSQYNRKPFAMALCCKMHGGPGESDIRFVRDGTTDGFNPAWCAFMPGFENLQESVAGFGASQAEAERSLKAAASAMEARRAATLGAVHESPVGKAETPTSNPDQSNAQ